MGFKIDIPDWVDTETKQNDGSDLLGLRNPVQHIGNSILNGITSITPSVRYLSLRSWIIWRYSQSGLPATWRSFHEFADRIESAIVLGNLMIGGNPGGLIGSQKAQELIESNRKTVSLERLVKNQTAIDNYASACYSLGFSIDSEVDIPGISEEIGLPLAQILEKNIGQTELANKLKSDPSLNKATRDELLEFGQSVQIQKILKDEREIILGAILTKHTFEDILTYRNRIATYGILLSLGSKLGAELEENYFFKMCTHPQNSIPPPLLPFLDEWLSFLVRDMLAVVHELTFGHLLYTVEALSGNDGYVMPEKVKRKIFSRADTFKKTLSSCGIDFRTSDLGSVRFEQFQKKVDDVISRFTPSPQGLCRWKSTEADENNIIELAFQFPGNAIVLVPIAWLIAKKRVESENASKWMDILSYDGHNRIGLRQIIIPTIDLWINDGYTLRQVWNDIFEITMNQHLRIAYDRMRLDSRHDVSCLLYSEERFIYKQDMAPGRTISRLRQAIGWLFQLGLLKNEGISQLGTGVLKKIVHMLEEKEAYEPA